MRKKVLIVVVVLIILIGSPFAYINYKKRSAENSVINYLRADKNIAKNDIVQTEPFLSNLRGNKNYMVSVKLKYDNKTYYYYKDNGKVILESYVENGREHVINK